VQNRTDEIATMCSELRSGGVVDIAHFMRGWSGQIAFDLVGIDAPKGAEAEACQDIVRLSARMATVLGFRRPSARQARDAIKDRDRLAAYFRMGYSDTAAPQSLAGRLQSLGLDFEEALGVLLIFVIGGTLTTSAALPRLLALFLDHGVFEQAIEDQSVVPRFVDEGLRLTAPLPGTVRIATRDVSLGERRISAGSRLVILTCNMARDPNLYDKPDRFDHRRIHAAGSGRLWFGAGQHRCAGFHLAQCELTTVLTHIAALQRAIRIESRRVSFASLLPAYSQLRISAGRRQYQ
jgi:cytochrome P450